MTDPIGTLALLQALEARMKLAQGAVDGLRDAAAKGDPNGMVGALLLVQNALGPVTAMTDGALALLKSPKIG